MHGLKIASYTLYPMVMGSHVSTKMCFIFALKFRYMSEDKEPVIGTPKSRTVFVISQIAHLVRVNDMSITGP